MSLVPGPFELVLILVVVLILFGAGRLPQVFESFGKGIKAFRQAANEAKDDDAIELSEKRELDDGQRPGVGPSEGTSDSSRVAEAEEVKSNTSA